jgi:predicted Zn-dependent protease
MSLLISQIFILCLFAFYSVVLGALAWSVIRPRYGRSNKRAIFPMVHLIRKLLNFGRGPMPGKIRHPDALPRLVADRQFPDLPTHRLGGNRMIELLAEAVEERPKRAMRGQTLAVIPLLILLLGSAMTAKAEYKQDDANDIGHRRVAHRSIISQEKEIAIGRQYAAQIERSAKILKDPVINEYVNRIEQNIARNSDAKIPITVKIIDDPTINASTLPGGFMFVNTGLLNAMDNEDELAGVLAHETGHVAARHWASNMTKQTILQYAMIPLMFTPMSAALYYGVVEGYMNGVPLAFLKFSREDEAQADFLGIQYLWKAGYDPNGLVEAFGKVLQAERSAPGSAPSIFMDHPPTGDRIIKAEEEIKNLLPRRQEYLVTTSEFNAMKSRLTMVMSMNRQTANNSNAPTLEKLDPGNRTPQGVAKDGPKSDQPPVLERRNETDARSISPR